MTETPVILASGGMDSFITWALYGTWRGAINLFVDIGHEYKAKELEALENLKEAAPGFDYIVQAGAPIGPFELTDSSIIPYRNAELILTAAQFGTEIWLGVVADEINSDKSPKFFTAMEAVLDVSYLGQYWNDGVGKTHSIRSPIRAHSKAQLVSRYLGEGNPPGLLDLTVSCYSGAGGKQCGACPSCFKRWVAMELNGLSEEYDDDPVEWAHAQGIIIKAQDGTYAEQRSKEILKAVG